MTSVTLDVDVVVVGAGMTGLSAARTLAAAGLEVTVLEASDRPGGQLRTDLVAGVPFDVGAEALHLVGPTLPRLLADLGLEEQLVTAVDAPTWIADGRRLHPLPAGLGPAGPSRLAPLVASSAVPLAGRLRAGLEPLFAGPLRDEDPTVGAFFRRRFGASVTDRLVEPLLGGLYSGDIDRMSLLATLPSLEERIREGRSLLRGTRARVGAPPPFVTLRGGLEQLTARLAASLTDVRTGIPVAAVAPVAGGYVVTTAVGDLRCRAVVVTTPAPAAAAILERWEDAGRALAGLPTTSVAVVVLGYPRGAVDRRGALAGTGALVPRTTGSLVKAVTFSSTKWPHLDGGEHYLLRASVGRGVGDAPDPDDDRLGARVEGEVARLAGLEATATIRQVVRWQVPSYEVGHRRRLAAAADALAGERIVVAGAPYRGVGIGTCVLQGAAAGRATAAALGIDTPEVAA